MTTPPRWITDTSPGHSQWYIQRFRTMAANGDDLAGEARLIDAIVPRRARILDAGCGPGRVGGELHRRGHVVVGVDVDPELIEAAETDHPGAVWLQGDLAELDLPGRGVTEPFDVAVLAGNVMTFLAPGSESEVLRRVGRHLKPDGRVVVGFGSGRGYALATFDADVTRAGLVVEQRFASWDLLPWDAASGFAVSFLRRSPGGEHDQVNLASSTAARATSTAAFTTSRPT